MDNIFVRNIFAAVFDKSVLDPLLKTLNPKSTRFWGTEGTIRYVKVKGYSGKSVVTGFDFDGRVKSLDRRNFVKILADRLKNSHLAELKKLKIEPYDLVIVDLYAPKKEGFPESMDIGGQALVRAAIKNYQNVALAFDKKSIKDVTSELIKNNGSTTGSFRKKQAAAASRFIAQRTKLESKLF
jgi:phosphoribosylaminoimidazolecarboxamide formyltransferase/IMP cyclohydrolase